jgi:hypothetical protein
MAFGDFAQADVGFDPVSQLKRLLKETYGGHDAEVFVTAGEHHHPSEHKPA